MIFVIGCVMVLMAGPTQAGELDDAIKRLGHVCGVPTFACQEACRSAADLAVTAIKAIQISSHGTRLAFTPSTFSSWNAADTRPASMSSLVTVLIETLHTREIERRDEPSTRRLRMRTRVSNGSLFMLRLI